MDLFCAGMKNPVRHETAAMQAADELPPRHVLLRNQTPVVSPAHHRLIWRLPSLAARAPARRIPLTCQPAASAASARSASVGLVLLRAPQPTDAADACAGDGHVHL